MMTSEDSKPWRRKILLDLQDRNRRQCDPFAELIKSRKYWYGRRLNGGMINYRIGPHVVVGKVQNRYIFLPLFGLTPRRRDSPGTISVKFLPISYQMYENQPQQQLLLF